MERYCPRHVHGGVTSPKLAILRIYCASKIASFLLTNLHMPLLAHGIDNAPLDGPPTGPTDWYTHLIVAGQTVELSLQLPGFSRQLLPVGH